VRIDTERFPRATTPDCENERIRSWYFDELIERGLIVIQGSAQMAIERAWRTWQLDFS